MWPNRVLNPGALALESDALPIALMLVNQFMIKKIFVNIQER